MNQKIVIIAHKNCMDGLASASIMADLYKNEEVQVIFCQYGEEEQVISDLRDQNITFDLIVMADFSMKKELMSTLCDMAVQVQVFDHHKTAEKELYEAQKENDNLIVHFDLNKSGAGLCYDYLCSFDPENDVDGSIIKYIQDRDLWTWELPNSKEFSMGLQFYTKPNDIDSFNNLPMKNRILETGEVLLQYQDKQVNSKLSKARSVNILGNDLMAVNATENVSELGNAMCMVFDKPALIYSITKDNQVICSLRSNDSMVDISSIAKQFDGGGHRNASGFTCGFQTLLILLT